MLRIGSMHEAHAGLVVALFEHTLAGLFPPMPLTISHANMMLFGKASHVAEMNAQLANWSRIMCAGATLWTSRTP